MGIFEILAITFSPPVPSRLSHYTIYIVNVNTFSPLIIKNILCLFGMVCAPPMWLPPHPPQGARPARRPPTGWPLAPSRRDGKYRANRLFCVVYPNHRFIRTVIFGHQIAIFIIAISPAQGICHIMYGSSLVCCQSSLPPKEGINPYAVAVCFFHTLIIPEIPRSTTPLAGLIP